MDCSLYAPVIDLDTGEVHVPDRQNVEIALYLARTAFIISNTSAVLFMAFMQYLLFRIRLTKSKIKPPTSAEKLTAVAGFWIVHRLLDVSVSGLVDVTVKTMCNQEIEFHYTGLRYGRMIDIGTWILIPVDWSWSSNSHLLFWEVLATFVLHAILDLNFAFSSFLVKMQQDPRRLLEQVRGHGSELVAYMRILFRDETPITSVFSTPSLSLGYETLFARNAQSINLLRYPNEPSAGAKRTLRWDLMVSKQALDEMMQTLGPPGGFGELEFSVDPGKVGFEGSGGETRLSLNFVLAEAGAEGISKRIGECGRS